VVNKPELSKGEQDMPVLSYSDEPRYQAVRWISLGLKVLLLSLCALVLLDSALTVSMRHALQAWESYVPQPGAVVFTTNPKEKQPGSTPVRQFVNTYIDLTYSRNSAKGNAVLFAGRVSSQNGKQWLVLVITTPQDGGTLFVDTFEPRSVCLLPSRMNNDGYWVGGHYPIYQWMTYYSARISQQYPNIVELPFMSDSGPGVRRIRIKNDGSWEEQ
jgi:hypothetical protein